MRYEYQVEIDGVMYGGNKIQSASIFHPLFDKLSVGNVCSANFKISYWPDEVPGRMAKIVPYIREKGAGAWERLGEFYTDTKTKKGKLMELSAYDPMLKGEVAWTPEDEMEFPMPMSEAVQILASLIGVAVDERTVISGTYTIDYPAGYTVRQVLSYIAAANGGNFTITQDAKLLFVPLLEDSWGDAYALGGTVTQFESYDAVTIDGIALVLDDNNEIPAGDQDGYVLEIVCPYGTPEMAEALNKKLSGKTYYGYRATAARLPPEALLGDKVRFLDGYTSFIAERTVKFGPYHLSEIAAPGENAVDHEYPYISQTTREFTRRQALMQSQIDKTAEEVSISVQAIYDTQNQQGRDLNALSDALDAANQGHDESISNLESQMSELALRVDELNITFSRTTVDEVTTKNGFTFNMDGLDVYEEGEEIHNTINSTGMYVRRGRGETAATMLQANADGVVATDLTARNYLIIGSHARFEDYENGRTACFYTG